ncbi:hypothetical protein, partial [Rhizobium sp. Pop5]
MSAIDFSDPAIIAFLTDALTAAGVAGIEISRPDGQIRIVISVAPGAPINAQVATPRASGSAPAVVKAPLAGHFCAEHPAAATPQTLPRSVSDADTLGFI